jgi:hypothetical protein
MQANAACDAAQSDLTITTRIVSGDGATRVYRLDPFVSFVMDFYTLLMG